MAPILELTAPIVASALLSATILFTLVTPFQLVALREAKAPWRALVTPICANIAMVAAIWAIPMNALAVSLTALGIAMLGRYFAAHAVECLPGYAERALSTGAMITLGAFVAHYMVARTLFA